MIRCCQTQVFCHSHLKWTKIKPRKRKGNKADEEERERKRRTREEKKGDIRISQAESKG